MGVAAAIVNGCVQSNPACKQYGNDLVNYMAAQLVASSNARANQQQAQIAAQQAASEGAAAAQMAEMQQQMAYQMQDMQAQMAQQQAESAARMEALMEQQRMEAVQAQSAALNPNNMTGASDAAMNAAALGISADVLVREQASGQILSKLDDVKAALKRAKAAMQDTFDYAGCNAQGDNCAQVRRVAAFKAKANAFFEPYDEVLDEVYDALIMAQALGVDITDIYMMLNGSCHVWGKYACASGQQVRYVLSPTPATANGQCYCPPDDRERSRCTNMLDRPCKIGAVVPMEAGGCQLLQMLTDQEDIRQNFLEPDVGSGPNAASIQIACASEALDQSKFFARRKKGSNIDIEILQFMLQAEAPIYLSNAGTRGPAGTATGTASDLYKFCAAEDIDRLRQAVQTKKLNENNMCVTRSSTNAGAMGLDSRGRTRGVSMGSGTTDECHEKCETQVINNQQAASTAPIQQVSRSALVIPTIKQPLIYQPTSLSRAK